MGLTGLEIYKQLPKSNCKECGVSTCLAFAMKVAAGQAGLDVCPRLNDAARGTLNEASAPPQRLVTIGEGESAVSIGQETVLYRHQEKFQHPCGIAVTVEDTLEGSALDERLEAIRKLAFERMGTVFKVDVVAVLNSSGDGTRLAAAARYVASKLGKALVLVSQSAQSLKSAAQAVASHKPLLHYTGGPDGLDEALAAAREHKLPLGLESSDLEVLVGMVEKARAAGVMDLVLSPGRVGARSALEFLTITRRAALQKKFRLLGYPVMTFALGEGVQAVTTACWHVLKYAGIVALSTVEPVAVLAVLTARFNIYTDPQKPVQVEPKLYAINEPGVNSPVLLTTNFALSYYSVASEVEASRIPAYILAADTEGTSVLTAWAADKFNSETLSKALEQCGIGDKVSHRRVIIPGHVAVISGGLEDESGWKVEVGPKEAVGLTSYLNSHWRR